MQILPQQLGLEWLQRVELHWSSVTRDLGGVTPWNKVALVYKAEPWS